jgi:hypothetical protein
MPRPFLFLLLIAALACFAGAAEAQAPVLRGRVITADGVTATGARAFVRWRGAADSVTWTDSAVVDSAGRFRIPLPDSLPDSLTVIVNGANGAYHPSLARLERSEAAWEHGFILVPRRWTIAMGSYAGQSVEISPERAVRPVCAGCSGFWMRMRGTRAPLSAFQGWPSARFPLLVAFDRAAGLPAGAAPDSALFWRTAGEVEAALGMDVFRAARYTQTLAGFAEEDVPANVVLVRVDRSLGIPGYTTTVGRRGTVEYAAVSLRSAGAASAPGGGELVGHELMHALGLGHTCAWRSVLADVSRCAYQRAPLPTAEDVAYTHLLYRVRDLQRGGAFRWGLEAAIDGEASVVR